METLKIGTLRWYHILNPSAENLKYLSDNFHFDPLEIEYCKIAINQWPKIVIYDDYYVLFLLFLCLYQISLGKG